MKIRLSQLRKLIREVVEAEMKHQGIAPVDEMEEMDEMEEGLGDDTDYTGGSEGRPSGQEDRDSKYWQEKNRKDKEEPYTGSY